MAKSGAPNWANTDDSVIPQPLVDTVASFGSVIGDVPVHVPFSETAGMVADVMQLTVSVVG